MGNYKIAFFKSHPLVEGKEFFERVRNDPKYDNNPLINKEAYDKAVKKYDKKLDILNKEVYFNVTDFEPNISGYFLAENIPEIPSIVVDGTCTKEVLYETLNKYDITHIALSTYATRLDKTIELIKTIQSEFKDKELYVGGVGTAYPHVQELVEPQNLCLGNGVNWLRKKFNLKRISNEEFKIATVIGKFPGHLLPVKAGFLVTQIGCPYKCDFCITCQLLKHIPFLNYNKIIKYIEDLSSKSKKDVFIYITEPNAFYPEYVWKKVFAHFIENPNKIDKNIFLSFLGSLNHINNFDLETIHSKSPIKFLNITYGIESTLNGGYLKNRGNPKKIIERLNKIGIITKQNLILGLPLHTPKLIDLDVKNNLKFKPDLLSINSFKPIPLTPLYEQLKAENRIYNRTLPPEFLYVYGFLPFSHKHLGGGFDILKYLFKAIYKSAKKLADTNENLTDKLLNLQSITNIRSVKRTINLYV